MLAVAVLAVSGGLIGVPADDPVQGPVDFARQELARAAASAIADHPGGVDFRVADPGEASPDGRPLGPEGFAIAAGGAPGDLVVTGGDERGAMYGGLEIAAAVAAGRDPAALAGQVRRPFLAHRQFKLNLPLAGTGYLSGEALRDNAWFWDEAYWDDFLACLARSRYDVLSLWSAHPYPQMVRLAAYPEVQDLAPAELERNIRLFHSIFRKARAHGIDVYLVTWNVHLSPSFAAAHGIPVDGADSDLVRAYQRECVRAVLVEYPDLTGIGTCPGEAMPQDARGREEFIRDTYLEGIRASGRTDVVFLHRYWGAEPRETEEVCAAASPVPVLLTIKFNGEHMVSSPEPHFFDRRWIDQSPRHYEVVWHLRNDDLFTLRWGDPDFVRVTVRAAGREGIGFLTGSEIWIDGADTIHAPAARDHVAWRWDFDRLWLRYALWGRLGYDPETPDAAWIDAFAARFDAPDAPPIAPALFAATRASSRLYPRLTSFHWNYMNGDWYPEGCVGNWVTGDAFGRGRNLRRRESIFHDVLEFVFDHPIDDGFVSIPELVALRLAGQEPAAGRMDAFAVAAAMERDAAEAERELAPLAGRPLAGELLCTVLDLRTQIDLGRYYAGKIRGAAHLGLHLAGFPGAQEAAIGALEEASAHWDAAAQVGDSHYREHEVWLMGPFSWGCYRGEVARDVELARRARPDPAGCRASPAFALPYDPHLDYDSLAGALDFGVAPFDPPPPLPLDAETVFLEAEDFAGPWREQANYPGHRGRGFRCAVVLGSLAPTSLRRRVEVREEAAYSLWVRGLVGHRDDRSAERSVQLFAGDRPLAATQTAVGVDPRFVWERAGELRLGPGVHELRIADHGPGYEHVDAVAISRAPGFDPAAIEALGDFSAAAPPAMRAVLEQRLAALDRPAPPADAAAAEARAAALRAALARRIGLDPLPPRTPLSLASAGEIDRGAFRIEKIVFESRPRFPVPAHVYRPPGEGPFPAVLVPVGHWIAEGKMARPMQELGEALARRGYLALIYDPFGQGERRVAGMEHRLALPLLLGGESDLAILLFDSMRALDVLAARPDVDPARIAVSGCSGGGMNAIYLAALDERPALVAPSCYATTYAALLAAGNHCEDNYVPGILAEADLGDVLGLAAPRPSLVLAASRDSINPVPATRAAVERARAWYASRGAGSALDLFVDDAPHDYSRGMRERLAGFLARHLRAESSAPETIAETWTPSPRPADDPAYLCFPAGYPSGARTVGDLARELLERRAVELAAAPRPPEETREALHGLLVLPLVFPRVERVEEKAIGGMRATKLVFAFRGYAARALLLSRAGGGEPAGAAAVVLSDAGIAGLLAGGWDALCRRVAAGELLLLLDPRGRGQDPDDEEWAWRASTMLGEPLAGGRVDDVLAAVAWLRNLPAVDPSRVRIEGSGLESALLALLAAAAGDVPLARADGTLASLRDVLGAGTDRPAIFVPNLLEVADIPDLRRLAEGQ
ncbi:MAG: acetylxylan esterase [Planctomycetota bacterium]